MKKMEILSMKQHNQEFANQVIFFFVHKWIH